MAFAASDGPSPGTQTLTVSGAGLTWTLVRRVNTQAGTSEIWRTTAPAVLTNVSVTSTQGSGTYAQSLTLVAFSGAAGTGVSVGANAPTGAPTVSLTTTQAGSLVYGVGNDWDRAVARTLGASQVLVHQYLAPAGDTMWAQNRTGSIASAGTVVSINDTAPTTDRWNLVAVEILAASPLVAVPNVVNQTQAASSTPSFLSDRVVSSPVPVPVEAPPRGSPPARARSPPRPSALACVVPSGVGSADTVAAAPCLRSQSPGLVVRGGAASGRCRCSADVDSARPSPRGAGAPAHSRLA